MQRRREEFKIEQQKKAQEKNSSKSELIQKLKDEMSTIPSDGMTVEQFVRKQEILDEMKNLGAIKILDLELQDLLREEVDHKLSNEQVIRKTQILKELDILEKDYNDNRVGLYKEKLKKQLQELRSKLSHDTRQAKKQLQEIAKITKTLKKLMRGDVQRYFKEKSRPST